MIFLADPSENPNPPRVAYAVGRKVGGAVTRNRLRRRLQAIVAECHRSGRSALAPGAYLLIPRSEAVSMAHRELSDAVGGAIEKATAA